MPRRAKPAKAKVQGKRPPAPKAPKTDDARVHDLEKRLAEAMEREKATGEILRVISSSPTDVQPVFDTIVASAARLCSAESAAVYRFEDDLAYFSAGYNFTPESREAYRRRFPRPLGETDHLHRVTDGSVLNIPDIENDPHTSGVLREDYRARKARSTVLVPILREGRAIGAIGVSHHDLAAFSGERVDLLKTFAAQAVIAIENVRLFTELRGKNRALIEAHAQVSEALDQQTATSEILRVISSSPTDVQPVFDTIAASAGRLLGGFSALVLRLVGDEVDLAALTTTSASGEAALRSLFPVSVQSRFPSAQAIRDRAPYVVTDSETDPRVDPDIARAQGWRSSLFVPMLREDAAVGVVVVTRRETGPFMNDEIALLKVFADQAVIAIENVRLFTELKEKNRALTQAHGQVTEALEQQTATSEILRVIAQAQTDAHPVFDAIAESALRLCGAKHGNVFLFDGALIHLAAVAGTDRDGTEAVRRSFPQAPGPASATTRAILTRRPVIIPDVLEDPEFQLTEMVRVAAFRGVMSIPMLRAGDPIGAITVTRAEAGPFSDTQLALLQTFADQAVIAIENARLFNETKEALDRQTATSEILRVISRSPTDVQPVFDAVTLSAARLCEARDSHLFRVEGGQLRIVAQHGPLPIADTLALEPTTASGRAVLERRTIHIADMQAEGDEYPQGSLVARRLGHRTVLLVPLIREGEAIGVLGVRRAEARLFSERQVALLQTFADQAVIAIENTRLFKELDEKNRALTRAHAQVSDALERQTATGEILRTIAHARTDVQPVFDTIVQNAARLCHADNAAVFLTDGQMVYLPANYGGSPETLAVNRGRFPRPLDANTPPGMAILTRSVVHVPDTEEPSAGEYVRQTGRLIGFRSGVSVPMLREGEAVGAIAVTRRDPGRFTDAEVVLLRAFADQAVIAIENVRLFKELEARTASLTRSVEQLTALGDVGRAVSSTLELAMVLDTIVERASQLAGADGCAIYEYDEGTQAFHVRATHNVDRRLVETLRATPLRRGEGVMGRATETGEPIQIADIAAPGAYESRLRDVLISAGYRALLSVPLLREGEIIGSLSLNRKAPGEFPREVIEVLKTFATQSALAIQNARLFREIAEKSRELEAASRHKSEFLANMSHELRTPLNAVIGFSEVLLQRMFGDLNAKQDEYLKDIYASGQHLLSLINDILDLSKIEAGRLELAPALFHLPTVLDNAVTLVKERAARHGIALGLDIDPRLGEIVADERKVKQVVLNLLSNAVKFTPEGGRISLKASRTAGAVEIAVTDTGIGIAPEDQAAIFEEFRQVGSDETRKQEGTGLGLTLAKKFVELHRGLIWVESVPGRGSTFTFTLPSQ